MMNHVTMLRTYHHAQGCIEIAMMNAVRYLYPFFMADDIERLLPGDPSASPRSRRSPRLLRLGGCLREAR